MKVLVPNNREESFPCPPNSNYSILQILWLNNLYNTHALCAGVGKCGLCKVEFISQPPVPTKDELSILSSEEIDSGIRLSCKHSAKDEYFIKIFDYKSKKKALKSPSMAEIRLNKKDKYFLAIDFGTSNVEYVIAKGDEIVQGASFINPMQGIGSEVMSRLEFAKKNANLLKERIWLSIAEIIEENKEFDIDRIIFSANSAMTYLALGLDTKCLAYAPYTLEYKGDSTENIVLENGTKLPPVYIPPLLAPFVGADITSGLLALKENTPEYPYFLIDMGTNAEFVLALSENKKFIASVPLGPSVEGIGLSFGRMAKEKDVIINFNLSPTGLKAVFLDKNQRDIEQAQGISGIAYIHLVKLLKNIGLLDKEGHFLHNPTMPLAKKIANYNLYGEPAIECLQLSSKLHLSSHDVESILKVKSAFRTSYDILMQESGLDSTEIKKVYIAGSFGKFIDKTSLIDLAFLPQSLKNCIEQVGNTSLYGAIHYGNMKEIEIINSDYQAIDLAGHKDFAQLYMENFTFNN